VIWLGAASQGEGTSIPSQIADQLRGREFRNFRALREAFWKAVANDAELVKLLKRQNLSAVVNGKAPYVKTSDRAGAAIKFELHHKVYVSKGGAVYDVDNIAVVTPRRHKEIHRVEE